MGLPLCFFTFLQLLLSLLFFHSTVLAKSLCHDDERAALLQFMESLIIDENAFNFYGDPCYPLSASWKPEEGNIDCCSWDGVKCNEKTGHVIKLELSNSCLDGSINSSNSLFHLVHLEWLNLAGNYFSFSAIPSAIMNLSELSYLNLSSSYFSGQIPSEMLQLSNLVSLDLSQNIDFELRKPSLGKLLEKLSNLKQLNLNQVQIASSIPHNLANLSNSLTYLSLQDCQLQGNIPSSIGNVTNLIHLSLSSNELLGTLPSSIGNLASLEVLFLSYNNFSSELPTSIENLAALEDLDLSYNKFSGELPAFIGNLTSLKRLQMSSSTFWGKLPPSLGNLTRLYWLDLSFNNFSGEFPTFIANIKSLEVLDISRCNFSGQIPPSLSNLRQLSALVLSHNKFSGTIDLDLFLTKLKDLQLLSLSSNKVSVHTKASVNTFSQKLFVVGLRSCNITEFPSFLEHQHQLWMLDLSSNKIHGKIPRWLLNTSVQSMSYLNLSQNLLIGFDDQHPIVFPRSTDPFVLDLSSNNLQGPLPIPPPQTINYLVSNNSLIGEVSTWVCKLNSLEALDLSYNNLSGELPKCLGNFGNTLSVLQLSSNKFSGSIPQTFRNGSFLKMIDLSNNLLQGRIPRSLANCRKLEFLDLGNNQISDTFPSWLGTLPDLNVLILQSNRFHGTIRETEAGCGFPKLRIIDLSGNRFTGMLPSKFFKCWNAMKSSIMFLSDSIGFFDYSLTISNKGTMMAHDKISNILVAIVLSGNQFVGEIPASIANLRELQILNLSNNYLQGHIPSSLSNLTNLESLDLSSNKLSGQVPQNLVELTFLVFFNVSHNNLSGPIPQGNQFATFDNSSFDGNSGLCGKPLSKKCGNDSETNGRGERADILSSESPFALDWMVRLIAYSSGLVAGVILGL